MPEKSPLYGAASQVGAVFVGVNGWLLPGHFGDPRQEYGQTCQQASLFDVSSSGKIEVTGPEAAAFLNNLCTNDILHLQPQAGCEAFFTNAKAKIVARAFIYRVPTADRQDSLWLDVDPGIAARLLQHLDHHLISEQVEFADRTLEFAQLHLAGPQAAQVLGKALKKEVAAAGKAEEILELSGLEPGYQVRRHQPLSLPGFDLLCPAKQAAEIWHLLLDSGARPAGEQAYEVLRVEAGTPVQGQDFDDNNLVMEVGRTKQAISYTKGCYLGQEPVVRARDLGHVNRSLLGLKLKGQEIAARGTKLFSSGNEVGQVTSSVFSPRLESAIALAYIRRGNQESGTVLDDAAAGGRPIAEVASLPFVGAT